MIAGAQRLNVLFAGEVAAETVFLAAFNTFHALSSLMFMSLKYSVSTQLHRDPV